MSESCRVSVVIPCYNAAGWIERAIESLRDQHYPHLEIIAIDDGSTDSTPNVLASLQEIRWMTTPNQGPGGARNLGLGLATGEMVLFLDADDYIDPGSLEEWVNEATGMDMVFGPFAHERGQRRMDGQGPSPTANAIAVASEWLNGRYTPTCSLLWRTNYVRGVGGWASGLLRNEDREIVLRGLLSGARVKFAQRGCGVYVDHEGTGRVSKRVGRAVFVSELTALEGIWNLAPGLNQGLMRLCFASAFYGLAYHCFATGVDDIGELALSRARELGLKGNPGPFSHRALAGMVGLRTKLIITALLKGRPRVVPVEGDLA